MEPGSVPRNLRDHVYVYAIDNSCNPEASLQLTSRNLIVAFVDCSPRFRFQEG